MTAYLGGGEPAAAAAAAASARGFELLEGCSGAELAGAAGSRGWGPRANERGKSTGREGAAERGEGGRRGDRRETVNERGLSQSSVTPTVDDAGEGPALLGAAGSALGMGFQRAPFFFSLRRNESI